LDTIIDEYKTIEAPAEGIYKEKGSKFLAYIYPVQSISDIENALGEIKAIHPKARHVCYAYKLGLTDDVYRANDDGEPSGTAGRPIYNELLSNELTDTLAAVVRYFGGTKLGVPGLINAYKTSTQDAISQSVISTRYITEEVLMNYPINQMGRIYDILKKLEIKDIQSVYDPIPHMKVQLRISQLLDSIHEIKAAYLGYSTSDIEVTHQIEDLQFKLTDGTIY